MKKLGTFRFPSEMLEALSFSIENQKSMEDIQETVRGTHSYLISRKVVCASSTEKERRLNSKADPVREWDFVRQSVEL